MQLQILHTTTYTYSQPVLLQPHTIRLRPRVDGAQDLHSYALQVMPMPKGMTQVLDVDGNSLVQVWFAEEPTEQLQIQVSAQVTTHRTNPFDFLLEPWATRSPIDYPQSLATQLKPYLYPDHLLSSGIEGEIAHTVQTLLQDVDGNTIAFLTQLNQAIHQHCQQNYRETGDPLPPAMTWNARSGSCRDLAVLLMAACRSVGLATRFVSGYQAPVPEQTEQHLHAWVEVYLPGAGWRGYDPTQGLAVTDAHIPLAASALPKYAAPVSGAFRGGFAQSQISYQLIVQLQ